MRATPNELVRAIRELLRTDIAAELKSDAALVSLKRIMAILRDHGWDEAGSRLVRENAALRQILESDVDRDDGLDVIAATESFEAALKRNARYREALAALIDATSQSGNPDAAALRGRAAALLAETLE